MAPAWQFPPSMTKRMLFAVVLLVGCGAQTPEIENPPGAEREQDPLDPGPSPADMGGGGGDASCGSAQFAIERVPPNVMLVVDRSGSMGDPISDGSTTTKWSDTKTALTQLVNDYDALLRLGITLYSSDGNCAAGEVTDYAPANGKTVLQKLDAKRPGGNTPTARTLTKVLKEGKLDDPTRENYVVLVTDGLPNCGDVNVKGKIDDLRTAGVKTFVIGVGDGTASNPLLLNQWAEAGGTARPGSTKYYQTNSQTELKAAFDAIGGGIASCTFKLMEVPPDPSKLFVFSNGQLVPNDPADGFSYDAASNAITLNGATCDQLKKDAQTKIQVVYGCPEAPIF